MENTEQKNVNAQEGAFLKSLIRINHPDWTPQQIETEFQRQMTTNKNNEDDGSCEACSG